MLGLLAQIRLRLRRVFFWYTHNPFPNFISGINNDWTFDDAIRTELGCRVFSFDPSMGVATHTRAKDHEFLNEALAGVTTVDSLTFPDGSVLPWKADTLGGFIKRLGSKRIGTIALSPFSNIV